VLELADLQEGAKGLRLKSADGYSSSVSLSEALSEQNFLAYEWEGEPVPILHGFPVRAIFPELLGNKWVKWLVKIEVY
jgi:DMSO/TMAO reductase YedYZ molybdopterin-dependent catalytic subunit